MAKLSRDLRLDLATIEAAESNHKNILAAIEQLRNARNLLTYAPNTRHRVDLALSSALGAARHAQGRLYRIERKGGQ